MPSAEAFTSPDQGNPYERVAGITFKQVVERIRFDKNDAPMIYLAVAPCRSGTTAQLRPFAEQGIPSHYQPLKAIYRRLSHEIDEPFVIPPASKTPALFIKETVGPYTKTESKFDPLQALLDAGYPPDRIQLLVEMREPLSTLTSWMENFSEHTSRDVLTRNYMTAVRTVNEIYENAKAHPDLVDPIPFVYESLRDNKPDSVSAKLLEKLGVKKLPFKLSEEEVKANIIFANEPPIYEPHKLHDRFKEEKTLVYFPKPLETVKSEVTPEQAFAILPAYETYHILRRGAEQSLEISVSV